MKVIFLPVSVELMKILKIYFLNKTTKKVSSVKTDIRYRIRVCSNGFGSLDSKAIKIIVYRVSEKGQGQRREGKNEG